MTDPRIEQIAAKHARQIGYAGQKHEEIVLASPSSPQGAADYKCQICPYSTPSQGNAAWHERETGHKVKEEQITMDVLGVSHPDWKQIAYDAYLLGCEDACIPEPRTKEQLLAKFGIELEPELTGTFTCPVCGKDTPHTELDHLPQRSNAYAAHPQDTADERYAASLSESREEKERIAKTLRGDF